MTNVEEGEILFRSLLCTPDGQVSLGEFHALDEVPVEHAVEVKTIFSAASLGTELEMIQRQIHAKSARHPFRLGYSGAGVVTHAGASTGFEVGERVAVYGAPYTGHAERLLVPKTLVAKIPDDVSMEEAATVGLGAIALHAFRSTQAGIGDNVLVLGLGILGVLASQIALSAGCNVIAFDPLEERRQGAGRFPLTTADDQTLQNEVDVLTKGFGVDAVLIAANREDPTIVSQALSYVRKRGRVIVMGDTETTAPREQFFQKEATLMVSQAAGPGRYDRNYEQYAMDYPYEYCRWTEGRNMSAFLHLLQRRLVQIDEFLGEPIEFEKSPAYYESLLQRQYRRYTLLIHYA